MIPPGVKRNRPEGGQFIGVERRVLGGRRRRFARSIGNVFTLEQYLSITNNSFMTNSNKKISKNIFHVPT